MKVRHVGITVTELDKSLKFYRDVLGFTITREMNESGKHIDNFSDLKGVIVRTVKMKSDDGSMIELLKYDSHNCPNHYNKYQKICEVGCSHFAMTVDDLEEVCQDVKDFVCASLICEPEHSPDGKVKLTFCRDPDGTLIELVEELN